MTNHAVKEPITDNTLCVEVEPQPDFAAGQWFYLEKYPRLSNFSDIKLFKEQLIKEHSPIAIGDTVYQGEEWYPSAIMGLGLPLYNRKSDWKPINDFDRIEHADWRDSETMPIELADKTFKVVGVEVEFKEWEIELEGNLVLNPPKWFWSYKLEEMKG